MSKQFILDLASYQSGMTPSQYKATGAVGAIIKLTESTNYTNPYISSLISKAQQGGIKQFAWYHFQRATTVDGMRAEANYCVSVAKKYGKAGDYIFLDAELSNAVPSTQAVKEFFKIIRANGFKAGFYTYQFMYGKFAKEIYTGCDGVWCAAYPLGNKATSEAPDFNYFPSQENVLMWQFTDNWCGLNVDCSYTLDDRLFSGGGTSQSQPTARREWYTTKLKQITLKQPTRLYKDKEMNEHVATFEEGTVFNIVGDPHKDSDGHVAYQTESGLWVTGDKDYIDSNYYLLSSYGGKNHVELLSTQGLYNDLGFKDKVRDYGRGTVFKIVGIEYSKSGYPRLKTESGHYITANKKYVKWINV